jgi:hypothetical protein
MSLWKLAGLSTPVIFAVLQIFTFKFRSAVGLALLQVGAVVLLVPLLQKRLKPGTVIAVSLLVLIGYMTVKGTEDYELMMGRFEEQGRWDFRQSEIQTMLSQLGVLGVVIGNGIGGWYWPPEGFVSPYPRTEMHIGMLFLVLKGGLVFLVTVLALSLRMLLPKPTGWYQNRYNLSAISVLPIFLLSQAMIPFPTSWNHLSAILAGLCVARMGMPRQESQEELGIPAVQADPVDAYNYGQMRTF